MSELSNYFSSVLRIVQHIDKTSADDLHAGDDSREQETPGQVVAKIQAAGDGKFASIEVSGDQPRPPLVEFDQICLPGDAAYGKLIAELVESTLLGFHGTVINLGLEASHRKEFLSDPNHGAIVRAARQILKCLKKTQRSRSVANLVVLCSYLLVAEETVHDLLDRDAGVEGATEVTEKRGLGVFKNGNEVTVTLVQAKATSDVTRMLVKGTEVGSQIVSKEQVSYHTIFTIRVEYAQFGSMAAPVSGTLSLVDLGTTDILYPASGESQAVVETPSLSLSSFAATVETLTSEGHASPNHGKSILMQLLKEALGGNCKTLLLCDVPEQITSASFTAYVETLKLASRARKIKNTPDRTELARKALMDAYMKELRMLHGSARLHQHVRQTSFTEKQDVEMAANALVIAAKGSHNTCIEESEPSDEEMDTDSDDDDNITEGRKNPLVWSISVMYIRMYINICIILAMYDVGQDRNYYT